MITYKLNCPTQYTSFEVLVIGKLAAFQNLNGINDRHATIEFTARNIVIEVLTFFYTVRPRIKRRSRVMNERVHCGTIPLLLEAYPLQQNAQSTHLGYSRKRLQTLLVVLL